MDSKIARWCDGLIEAGWLAAIVATPLFFNIHSSRVFEPDKLTLMRSIALMMSAAWLIKFVDLQGWRSLNWLKWRSEETIWRMPFVLPVFFLVVIYLVSSLFSVTKSVSLAGSYQRLQGTYTTLAYITIFALMLATVRTREQVSRIVTVVIITSIPVSLYAMLQHFGLDPLPWGGNVQRRVAGHMGNSIFVAAYLIMTVPLTLGRIVDAFTNILGDDDLSQADVIRSSIYIFTLAVQLIAIYWTRSRGPFLGLAVSIYAFVLVTLVTLRGAGAESGRFRLQDLGQAVVPVFLGVIFPFYLGVELFAGDAERSFAFFVAIVALTIVFIFVSVVARRGWRWLWLSWIFLAVSLAGFLFLFNLPAERAEKYLDIPVFGDGLQTLVAWRDLPEIGRFGQLLEAEEGSGRVRVLIWEGVLDLIAPHEPIQYPNGDEDRVNFLRPLIGYGPESMYVAYNRFYPPELATIEARNASPDRSHNETFDALVITGATGLLVWQALYLSVFFYGFRWLGVVRTKRDRNALIGFWIGGALLSAVVITSLLGMPFLGVALPFGTIGGLVLYLVYYALATSSGGDDVDPFSVDRLLMIGLVAAVLAHYVEIHFGIAIASTRTHFFVYIALMFLVGHLLPARQISGEAEEAPMENTRRRRRGRQVSGVNGSGWAAPVLSITILLGFAIGILAYNFMNFSLPQGETIQTIDQVPAGGEILHQSFFVNPGEDFTDSPFVFLMIILTWILGVLLALSEFAKRGVLQLTAFSVDKRGKVDKGRLRIAAGILVGLAVTSIALALSEGRVEEAGLNQSLGGALLYVWAGLCAFGASLLFLSTARAQIAGGVIALTGFVFAIPTVTAGQTRFGFLLVIAAGVVLYLLWDVTWNDSILPAAILAIGSVAIGLLFAYFHAFQIRAGILPPAGVTEATPLVERQVLQAEQSGGLLTTFYVFAFSLLFLAGIAIAQDRLGRLRVWSASTVGTAALVLLIPVSVFLIATTNLRIIQADVVYKRADPFDKQAGRSGDPSLWSVAVAIYESAIDLAPREDFYYLWLGRALLEEASVTQDESQKEALLATASDRLKRAQEINPLNTDHTANLARLNTRWAEFTEGDERSEKVATASDYYEAAMALSPHNAVIINEYARLAYILQNDCDNSLALYARSVEADPFYTSTYFDRAEIYQVCGDNAAEGDRESYYERAKESINQGLDRQPNNGRRWLQLAELTIKLGETEGAIAAYQQALQNAKNLPPYQVDFSMAQWFLAAGERELAAQFADSALRLAPEEVVGQIQQFLAELNNPSSVE